MPFMGEPRARLCGSRGELAGFNLAIETQAVGVLEFREVVVRSMPSPEQRREHWVNCGGSFVRHYQHFLHPTQGKAE